MAHGDLEAIRSIDTSQLPYGSAVTASGRISVARPASAQHTNPPFDTESLVALDDNLTWATRLTGLRFLAYIGDFPSDDPYEGAAKILNASPEPQYSVLIAVSPNTKDVVVLSGSNVATKVTNNTAGLGVSAAITTIKDGNLIDGIIAGIRVIALAAKQ